MADSGSNGSGKKERMKKWAIKKGIIARVPGRKS